MSLGKNTLLQSVVRYDIKKKNNNILVLLSSLISLIFFLLLPFIFKKIIENYNHNIIEKKVVLEESFIYGDFNGNAISFKDSLNMFTFSIFIPLNSIMDIQALNRILKNIEEVVESSCNGYLIKGFIEKEAAVIALTKLINHNIIKENRYDILDPIVIIND